MTTKRKSKKKPLPRGAQIALKALRLAWFPILCLIGLFIGLRIGYVQLGGGDPADVAKWDTWKHMFDLVFADP